MARRKVAKKREVLPDPIYSDVAVTKFINSLMYSGCKSIAERIFYGAIVNANEKSGEKGVDVFHKALDNVRPLVEVKSRKVGGASYPVPIEVQPVRRQALAIRWLIAAARNRKERTMVERLTNEILDAASGKGGAVKKREETHRIAEANRAFAHFR